MHISIPESNLLLQGKWVLISPVLDEEIEFWDVVPFSIAISFLEVMMLKFCLLHFKLIVSWKSKKGKNYRL